MPCNSLKSFSDLLTPARLVRLKAFGLTPSQAKELVFHTAVSSGMPLKGTVASEAGKTADSGSGSLTAIVTTVAVVAAIGTVIAGSVAHSSHSSHTDSSTVGNAWQPPIVAPSSTRVVAPQPAYFFTTTPTQQPAHFFATTSAPLQVVAPSQPTHNFTTTPAPLQVVMPPQPAPMVTTTPTLQRVPSIQAVESPRPAPIVVTPPAAPPVPPIVVAPPMQVVPQLAQTEERRAPIEPQRPPPMMEKTPTIPVFQHHVNNHRLAPVKPVTGPSTAFGGRVSNAPKVRAR